MTNQSVWNYNNVVKQYQRLYLDKPEETIYYELKPKLQDIQMLDIGVGGGRTTHFFAPLAKEYIGIDYSEAMIESCNSKYKNLPNVSFNVCDARDMTKFHDESFDFILFSYNGIDYVGSEGRLKVLQEMHRVCKSGGWVCFSGHNLQSLDSLFSPQFSTNPLKLYSAMRRYVLLRYYNKYWQRYKNVDECELIDPALNFQLTTVYVTPKKQVNQLTDLGFKNVRIFSLFSGTEILNPQQLNELTDPWLYYFAEV
jgi:ubiquinone/menaquinone biosynthesis C-methylase UbiE